ncbi:unnamed protein product [Bursaphelenchus xylophilus]|uniref:(pine wood nematode) hypothetical protein n=1 Tax=Bursaphelenchus xylophilus TaxID=6326 RepID=A0A1I7RYV4_BURXY|nr:unnamed protein product [Bursaphelenchus xylophilus]CAG9092170.1 unnamed protein product [Bursaphelenchus xylophilus]
MHSILTWSQMAYLETRNFKFVDKKSAVVVVDETSVCWESNVRFWCLGITLYCFVTIVDSVRDPVHIIVPTVYDNCYGKRFLRIQNSSNYKAEMSDDRGFEFRLTNRLAARNKMNIDFTDEHTTRV